MESGKLSSWPAPPSKWRGHTNSISCLQFSPDGRHIISGSFDRTIRIWDFETGTVIGEPIEGHSGRVFSVAYSLMGGISSLDQKTGLFESGMRRLV